MKTNNVIYHFNKHRDQKNITFVSLIMGLLLGTALFAPVSGPVTYINPATIGISFAIFIIALHIIKKQKINQVSFIILIFGFFLFIHGLAIVENMVWPGVHIRKLLLIEISLVGSALIYPFIRDSRIWIVTVKIVFFITCLVVITFILFNNIFDGFFTDRNNLLGFNRNHFFSFSAIGFAGIIPYLKKSTVIKKIIFLLLLSTQVIYSLVLGSVGGFIIFLLLAIMTGWILLKRIGKIAMMFSISVLFVVFLGFIEQSRLLGHINALIITAVEGPDVALGKEISSVFYRIQGHYQAILLVIDTHGLGVGLRNTLAYMELAKGIPTHSHHTLLESAASMGITGIVLIGGLWLISIWGNFRQRHISKYKSVLIISVILLLIGQIYAYHIYIGYMTMLTLCASIGMEGFKST